MRDRFPLRDASDHNLVVAAISSDVNQLVTTMAGLSGGPTQIHAPIGENPKVEDETKEEEPDMKKSEPQKVPEPQIVSGQAGLAGNSGASQSIDGWRQLGMNSVQGK
jgi:hypothetical protein